MVVAGRLELLCWLKTAARVHVLIKVALGELCLFAPHIDSQ